MRKHILIVSQYFYPEQFRINDIASEWVKKGYKVTVLTGIPNYPQGKFYKGYNWFKKRKEIWNGIDIIRIPLFARGKTFIGMVLNYLSFIISGWFWKNFTKVKADLVFTFEVSPMTQALVGVWYSKRRKIPHYIYVQDLWPENVEIVTGIHSKLIINPISKMVNYIYKHSDKIFATSPSFVTEIQKRTPDEKDKVLYWPQYAEDFYVPMEKHETFEVLNNGKTNVVFTGNIGQAQGLDLLPKTARILKEKGVADINFVIVGDGRYKKQLLDDIEQNNVADMFTMIDRQPPEKIPELLSACDIAFISFMDNSLFSMTIPAKLQSYMACGKAIIAAATGETERIICEAECGICSKIGDADALAEGIVELKNNYDLCELGKRSRKYFEINFDKYKLLDAMEEYINDTEK